MGAAIAGMGAAIVGWQAKLWDADWNDEVSIMGWKMLLRNGSSHCEVGSAVVGMAAAMLEWRRPRWEWGQPLWGQRQPCCSGGGHGGVGSETTGWELSIMG